MKPARPAYTLGPLTQADAEAALEAAIAATDAFRRDPRLLSSAPKDVASFAGVKRHMTSKLFNYLQPQIQSFLDSRLNRAGGKPGTLGGEAAYHNLASAMTLAFTGDTGSGPGIADQADTSNFDVARGAIGKLVISGATVDGTSPDKASVGFRSIVTELHVLDEKRQPQTLRITTSTTYYMVREGGVWLVHSWNTTAANSETVPA